MKFRIVKGGSPGSWTWTHTIQKRRLKWLPYPRFVWEDYKLGPWYGRFAGGTAYAKDPDAWTMMGLPTYHDKDHREAKAFIKRESRRIRQSTWVGKLIQRYFYDNK